MVSAGCYRERQTSVPNLRTLLNTHSFFSSGGGVSSPKTLVERAATLGYTSIALTDEGGVYGAVEAQQAARAHGVRALVGATARLEHDKHIYPLVLIAGSRRGYRVLNELLTYQHSHEAISLPVLQAHTQDLFCLTGGRRGFPTQLLAERRVTAAASLLLTLRGMFHDRLFVQLYFDHYPSDMRRARVLRSFARENRVSIVAAPEVRYASPELYELYDALVCVRLGITVETPHRDRPQNDCQAIPNPQDFTLPFPEAVANADALAQEAHFDLLAERLTPPPAKLPLDITPQEYLERRCYEALGETYQGALFSKAKERLEQELVTLRALDLAGFFLVAAEVTDFCRSRGIVASGRGSAAASVVCYLLGVTTTDPVEHNLLFERFLHTGRTSLPDVDIDIGSSRRDEVLAWVEERFEQSTQAMVCNRTTYRLPLAVQDLGRALGLPPHLRNRLSKALGRDFRHLRPHRAREAEAVFSEVLSDAPVKRLLLKLLEQMERGFVRHVAPHSGGVVLSREPLAHYSPLERSTGGIQLLQFDKDDAEALGLIKLDLLGLRMLGVFERTREEVYRTEGTWLELSDLPNDEDVWKSVRQGDTMGLFQIESPAQTRITVDLQPQSFLDLAHQVALIRPGPIQSGTVHPYVRRKKGLESVSYLHPCLEPILEKSYGVLLFQEDIMRIAVSVAGFSWGDAEAFRKAVNSYEEESEIASEKRRFLEGARRTTGLNAEEALKIFDLCSAFRGYGFAESHAWAFGAHAYTSAWLRHHHPAEYIASLLTEDPGMWPRGTIRQEAKRWGVSFSKLCINRSNLTYTVERDEEGKSVRLPLTVIKGLSERAARDVVLERLQHGPYADAQDLYERTELDRDTLEFLARAGAFDALQTRRDALYQLGALPNVQPVGETPLLNVLPETPSLPDLPVREQIAWDYQTKAMSEWGVHPVDLIRQRLLSLGATPMARLPRCGVVTTAGLVVAKQKPPTAGGFAFYVLEDGHYRLQLVISPDIWEAHRDLLRDAPFILATGEFEKRGRAWTLRAAALWGAGNTRYT